MQIPGSFDLASFAKVKILNITDNVSFSFVWLSSMKYFSMKRFRMLLVIGQSKNKCAKILDRVQNVQPAFIPRLYCATRLVSPRVLL
jgi:hypothetical protein